MEIEASITSQPHYTRCLDSASGWRGPGTGRYTCLVSLWQTGLPFFRLGRQARHDRAASAKKVRLRIAKEALTCIYAPPFLKKTAVISSAGSNERSEYCRNREISYKLPRSYRNTVQRSDSEPACCGKQQSWQAGITAERSAAKQAQVATATEPACCGEPTGLAGRPQTGDEPRCRPKHRNPKAPRGNPKHRHRPKQF